MPKKTFVLKTARISSVEDNLTENICVNKPVTAIKIPKYSSEKMPMADVIIKYQSDNPRVTATALNLAVEVFILNRID